MKAVAGYGVTAGVVVVAGGLLAGWALSDPAARAVWWSAGVSYAVQLGAFAALVAARDRGPAFFAAWGAGMLGRLGIVVVVAVWLTRSRAHPPAPTLLSLAGFLFLLVLLEPVFFRRGRQRR